MKRLEASLAMALVLAGVPISTASAGPGTGANGYLVGSASPLTATQVAALQNAGANVKYVYQNFGGAAVVAPANAVDAIRKLSFVSSVSADTVKQLNAIRRRRRPLCPERPTGWT